MKNHRYISIKYYFAVFNLLILLIRPAMAEQMARSIGIRYSDSVGDIADEYCSFDLVGLSLASIERDTLKITFTTREPLPANPPRGNSWIGLYMDMDLDGSTGLSISGIGTDMAFSVETVRGKWEATVGKMGTLANSYDFEVSDLTFSGNRTSFTVTSNIFQDYPSPVLAAWSHCSGEFLDEIDGMATKPLELFGQEGTNGHKGISFKKSMDIPSGHYDTALLPIDDATKEVILDIEVKKANLHRRWLSTVELRLNDNGNNRRANFRVAASVSKKDKSVIRIHIDGDSEKPHYMNRPYKGNFQLKVLFTDSDEMEFYVDGKLFERHKKAFSISGAKLFMCSTTADVNISIL